MSEHYFVASPGVLGIRTNLRNFKWSFGINTPESAREQYDACAVRMCLNIGPIEHFQRNGASAASDGLGKYHYFSGEPGADRLYYQRAFLFRWQLQIEASGLLSDEPCISANRTYHKYITHRFMNLHSIGYIMTDLAALLLLRRGFAPVHCSAFRKGDSAVVVFAPPNTGKTLTAMMACMEFGADFLAEDIAITDGAVLYSVPWTSTFRYYSRVEEGLGARLINSLTRVIPPLELLSIGRHKPVSEYIDSGRIVDNAKITHLVLLERGPEAVSEQSARDVIGKIINLNRYEFCYVKSPLITAHEFFNPALDVEKAVATEKDILLRTAENARQRLVVRTTDPTCYASLIMDALK